MKKLIALVAFLSMVNIDVCFACPSPPCEDSSSGSSSSSGSGSSSSEANSGGATVKTKYSVSEAEAASTDGSTNSVSWTFE